MAKIHKTAIVDPNAKIHENVTIGPYAYIEADVEIDDGTEIGPHACIYNGARIGKNVKIFQSAAVSNRPQDLKYAGEKTFFYIGDNSIVREFVTLHRGTTDTGRSKIGKDCLIMAYTHVAHDCVIGNNCIIANSVQIAGHVTIEDWVIVGGGSLLHQFGLISEHSMLQGGSHVSKDVPPYVLTKNIPFQYMGLNTVGLRRRGFSNEDINVIKEAYQILYFSGLNITEARQKLIDEFDNKYVTNIIKFIDKPKKRSILTR